MSSDTDCNWSLSSPKASIIRPNVELKPKFYICFRIKTDFSIKKSIHTLDYSQEYNDYEEKEGYVEYNPIDFVFVAVGRLDLIADTTARSDAFV